jgi:hypothetical protein
MKNLRHLNAAVTMTSPIVFLTNRTAIIIIATTALCVGRFFAQNAQICSFYSKKIISVDCLTFNLQFMIKLTHFSRFFSLDFSIKNFLWRLSRLKAEDEMKMAELSFIRFVRGLSTDNVNDYLFSWYYLERALWFKFTLEISEIKYIFVFELQTFKRAISEDIFWKIHKKDKNSLFLDDTFSRVSVKIVDWDSVLTCFCFEC